MPSTPRNRVGDVYGQLTVYAPSDRRTKSGNAYWWCRCKCGREREVAGDKLSFNVTRTETCRYSLRGMLKRASN
jgi:hypothetical protein